MQVENLKKQLSDIEACALNQFPQNDALRRVWERSFLKTLREKEKLLVQAISPFFPQCFLLYQRQK